MVAHQPSVIAQCGCSAGTQPSADLQSCVDCTGTAYSACGSECVECSTPYVVNAQRSTCSACPPGQEPNSDRTGCVTCAGSTYSPYGTRCEDCAAPNIVSSNKITCSRGGCSLGQECKSTSTAEQCLSDSATHCADCTGGKVSDGSACTQCEPGKIPNAAKSACTSSSPGRVPNAAATSCQRCPEGKYSAYGVACNACEQGKFVDAMANCTSDCGKNSKYPSSGCNSCGDGTYVYTPQAEAAWRERQESLEAQERSQVRQSTCK